MYRLIVYTEHHSDHRPCWRDSGEGPWPNYFNDALRFAVAECGAPWVIVNRRGHPVAYGDCQGMLGGPDMERKEQR